MKQVDKQIDQVHSSGECNMALSIAGTPAAGVENRSVTFADSLRNLAGSVSKHGVGIAAATSERDHAADPRNAVRAASDQVAEARAVSDALGKVVEILEAARSQAFRSINEPGGREREQDHEAYRELWRKMDALSSRVLLGGESLLAGSSNFGPEGDLSRVDLSTFQGSVGAIQVIDRAIGEIVDQRGLLGIFQSSRLAQIGNLLRKGIGGSVDSASVVRDRTVAIHLAQSAVAELVSQSNSSLLGRGNESGQVLATILGGLR